MIAEMSMWTSMMTCKAMPSVYTELNPDTMSVLVANIASWARAILRWHLRGWLDRDALVSWSTRGFGNANPLPH